MKELDVSKCCINDKILNIMMTQGMKNISNNADLFYNNLIRLDLSNNDLTDLCFISLSIFVTNTPYLSDLILNNNRIKLLSTSAFKREDK